MGQLLARDLGVQKSAHCRKAQYRAPSVQFAPPLDEWARARAAVRHRSKLPIGRSDCEESVRPIRKHQESTECGDPAMLEIERG